MGPRVGIRGVLACPPPGSSCPLFEVTVRPWRLGPWAARGLQVAVRRPGLSRARAPGLALPPRPPRSGAGGGRATACNLPTFFADRAGCQGISH